MQHENEFFTFIFGDFSLLFLTLCGKLFFMDFVRLSKLFDLEPLGVWMKKVR
jgi:hypothetical protein